MEEKNSKKHNKKAAAKSKPAKRFVWVLILVIIAASAVAYAYFRGLPGSSNGSNIKAGTFTVQRSNLTISVT